MKSAFELMETDISLEMAQQFLKMKSGVIDSIVAYLDKAVSLNGRGDTEGERSNANGEVNLNFLNQSDGAGGNDQGRPAEAREADQIIEGVLGDIRLASTHMGCNGGVVGENADVDMGGCNGLTKNSQIEHPTFSIGLTQEGIHISKSREVNPNPTVSDLVDEARNSGKLLRKSKRAKIVPANLLEDYHVDKRMVSHIRGSKFRGMGGRILEDCGVRYGKLVEKLTGITNINLGGISVATKDFLDICGMKRALPPKMVDVLMGQTRSLFKKPCSQVQKNVEFFDSKFVAHLVKNYSKFNKMEDKDSHVFHKHVLEAFSDENAKSIEADRFYVPFNFDKTHWVGLCVDCNSSTIVILDHDVGFKNDVVIAKELTPLGQLFPYLLKQIGCNGLAREHKEFSVKRAKGVPQHDNHVVSGVGCILLMQVHAIGGFDGCLSITPTILLKEAERMSLMIYEDNIGRL